MHFHAALRGFILGLFGFLFLLTPLAAQSAAAPHDAELQFVLVLSRHGIRSPLGNPEFHNKYSAAPWPTWNVAPGILTTHGYELMKLFGIWDRAEWAGDGLFAPSGCDGAERVSVITDNDQRTRATGKALTEGIFPGCTIALQSQPDGVRDPLFLPLESGAVHPDAARLTAAVSGRIGGDPNRLTEAYRPQLTALDRVLAGCGKLPANAKRISIFDVPASLTPGSGGKGTFSLRGPVPTGASLAGDLLLEYTQGMSEADTGWGCLNGETLRYVMQLTAAGWEYEKRTPTVARMNSTGLLESILKTLEQNASGKPVKGALGKPGDRLVLLVGHDTNIAALSGALGVNWIMDGRISDPAPGGALRFEIWRARADGKLSVRLVYAAQTLDQMRRAEPLTPANPPAEAVLFVPACSRADQSCSWEDFSTAARQAIDPAYLTAQP